MLEPIILESTEDNPKVILDKNNNRFEISERSLPEDAIGFYEPIQQWISDYVKNPNPATEFIIKLEYFNSSSASRLVKIMLELEKIMKSDNEIKVTWYYQENDLLIRDRGEEFKSVLKLPIEIKEYDKKNRE